jgi:hypothetical protein
MNVYVDWFDNLIIMGGVGMRWVGMRWGGDNTKVGVFACAKDFSTRFAWSK